MDFDIGDEIGTTGTKTFDINVSDAVVPVPETETESMLSPATTTTTTTNISIREAGVAGPSESDDKEQHSMYQQFIFFVDRRVSALLFYGLIVFSLTF